MTQSLFIHPGLGIGVNLNNHMMGSVAPLPLESLGLSEDGTFKNPETVAPVDPLALTALHDKSKDHVWRKNTVLGVSPNHLSQESFQGDNWNYKAVVSSNSDFQQMSLKLQTNEHVDNPGEEFPDYRFEQISRIASIEPSLFWTQAMVAIQKDIWLVDLLRKFPFLEKDIQMRGGLELALGYFMELHRNLAVSRASGYGFLEFQKNALEKDNIEFNESGCILTFPLVVDSFGYSSDLFVFSYSRLGKDMLMASIETTYPLSEEVMSHIELKVDTSFHPGMRALVETHFDRFLKGLTLATPEFRDYSQKE